MSPFRSAGYAKRFAAVPYILERRQLVGRPLDEVFAFFSRAENLQSITPAWLEFRILHTTDGFVRQGTRIEYALRWRKLPLHWTTEIIEWDPPRGFIDEQVSGPYRLWRHEHRFTTEHGQTVMSDRVTYAMPFGPIGILVHALLVRRDVEAIFDYRAAEIRKRFG